MQMPFERIQNLLAEIYRDDPKLAFQAARLVGLYRRLWEPCTSKHARAEQLGHEAKSLKEASVLTNAEKDELEVRLVQPRVKLHAFDQALNSTRKQIINIMKEWDSCESVLAESVAGESVAMDLESTPAN